MKEISSHQSKSDVSSLVGLRVLATSAYTVWKEDNRSLLITKREKFVGLVSCRGFLTALIC